MAMAADVGDVRAQVISTCEIAPDFHLTRLLATDISTARPGQFVNIRVRDGIDPFLRLPLSVAAADPVAGTIDLMYEDLGPKSHVLCQASIDSHLACVGPLGNSFPLPDEVQRVILVAGGIGLPPVLFYGRHLIEAGVRDVRLLVGARSSRKLLPDELFVGSASAVSIATDDGSLGHHGLVTDLLDRELGKASGRGESAPLVCSCGPHPMMSAVAAMCAERAVACYVSLEEYMACGFGVCVGCVVERRPSTGGSDASPYNSYSRICVDGPVYNALEINW